MFQQVVSIMHFAQNVNAQHDKTFKNLPKKTRDIIRQNTDKNHKNSEHLTRQD